jgi:hypothetical protein
MTLVTCRLDIQAEDLPKKSPAILPNPDTRGLKDGQNAKAHWMFRFYAREAAADYMSMRSW